MEDRKLRWPRVLFISDGAGAPFESMTRVAAAAQEAGIPLALQLREKALCGADLLQEAGRLVAATDPERIPVLVNGRLDVALAAGAAGVHLPAEGVPPGRVRAAVGRKLHVGVSTHSEEEVRQAVQQGADSILFGPVFSTPSKAGMGEPQGLERLARAAAAAGGVPLLAVGGVTPDTATSCRQAGAWGVAAIRALQDAADPVAVLKALAGELD
jgi:thiamine-phosphate pyrophosphorylase